MKKLVSTLAIGAFFITGLMVMGCQSSSQKADDAQAKVEEAKDDLQDARQEANEATQQAANAEQWEAFKAETDVKIKDNELRIGELKVKMKKSGKTMDSVYANNIENLEQKNKDLKIRMDGYQTTQSDWESFKREFNHDMDELGQALKDLGVDNKN